ncbi:MAG: tRNA (adenosine(37)-N6)-dimethylallyltransferase MiaA [Candidatus Latescibacterota bacterium]|nr:tRNA (adenosine(37)-N6)-dimethylallyltransferase MiaA [Candidatus Latescibacterota bacterium]
MILISGPTAIGKTEVGIRVCQMLDKAEIISVDSRQIYRYMDVGTAKPSLEECQGITHHFLDCLFPTQSINAGEFARRAWIIINELTVRGVTPVLVGGSGLYWQAIIDGLYEEKSHHYRHRDKLKKRLKQFGIKSLYLELQKVDPVGSERVSERDSQRILRALEVFYDNGISLSQKWLKNEKNRSQPLGRGLMIAIQRPRPVLYGRINTRVDRMVKLGLVDEVKKLLCMYENIQIPPIDTIGYREIISYLNGRTDLNSTIEQVKQNTRRFAKRQLTLLSKDRRFRNLDIETNGIEDCASRIVEHYKRLDTRKSFDSIW